MGPVQRTTVLDQPKVLAVKLLVIPDSQTPVLHAGGERALADLLGRLDKAPETKHYTTKVKGIWFFNSPEVLVVADRKYPRAHRHNVTDLLVHLLCLVLGNIGPAQEHTTGRAKLWFSLPGVLKVAHSVDTRNHGILFLENQLIIA